MKYKIVIDKVVIKFLRKHPFLYNPFSFSTSYLASDNWDILDVKPLLGGEPNSYRLRIGRYRFLFRVEGKVIILFYDVGSRGNIYK